MDEACAYATITHEALVHLTPGGGRRGSVPTAYNRSFCSLSAVKEDAKTLDIYIYIIK
jgi:hypothetical protein